MVLYAQSPKCRWRLLLEYFGPDVPAPEFRCGVCDNCVHPPDRDIKPPSAGV
jgi:ATP-dependent DNA helicase RecQ